MSITFAGAKSKTQQINLKQLPNDVNKSNDKEVSKQTGSRVSQTSPSVSSTAVEPLVVLFSEKGRCHFCRLLCPDIQVVKVVLQKLYYIKIPFIDIYKINIISRILCIERMLFLGSQKTS